MFVEVKANEDKLRESQRQLFAALETIGVKVKVWWQAEPDTLMPWRAFDDRTKAFKHKRRVRRAKARARNPRMLSPKEMAALRFQRPPKR